MSAQIPNALQKRVYSLREFSQLGGPQKTKCYRLIREGKLRVVKDGKSTRISASEVDRYFRDLEGQGATSA